MSNTILSNNIYWGILIAALVTALIRGLPILFFAHRSFPILLKNWLNFIPPAILSAIIAAEVMSRSQVDTLGIPVALAATILAFIAGFLTRNLFITVIVSVVSYLIFQSI